MKETTKEWKMVCDLNAVKDKITHRNQKDYVELLHSQLDEYLPIAEQRSESEIEYLYTLYRIYIDFED